MQLVVAIPAASHVQTAILFPAIPASALVALVIMPILCLGDVKVNGVQLCCGL